MEIFRSAYHAGCNDYIQTPYKLEELEIRINYIKKVFNLENKGSIIINDTMIFDISNYLIIKDNQKIPLPKKEAYILKYFLENKNETVLTDDLIINIWQYNNAPSVSTIRTYIMNMVIPNLLLIMFLVICRLKEKLSTHLWAIIAMKITNNTDNDSLKPNAAPTRKL